MNIYHKLKLSYSIRPVIIKHALVNELLDSGLIAQTPLNTIQPLFPRWYNPNKKCNYHDRVLSH